MRHQKHKYKLGVAPEHRKSMIRNLASDLIKHGKIKSTHTRCKAVQPFVEKLVTIAKTDSVANRRLAFSKLNSEEAVGELFKTFGPRFKERSGGYTRISKLAETRFSDASKMSYISFLEA